MQRFKSPEQANDFLSAHCVHLRSFPSTTTPTDGHHISRDQDPSIQCLAAGQRASKMPRDDTEGSAPTSGCQTKVNVTMFGLDLFRRGHVSNIAGFFRCRLTHSAPFAAKISFAFGDAKNLMNSWAASRCEVLAMTHSGGHRETSVHPAGAQAVYAGCRRDERYRNDSHIVAFTLELTARMPYGRGAFARLFGLK